MANKTIKVMLIDLYKEEREQERCAIVHELKMQAEDIAKPHMNRINDMEENISDFNKQISDIRSKIRKNLDRRDAELRRFKLFTFTHQTCGDALHQNLIEFDKETNDHIRSILEG